MTQSKQDPGFIKVSTGTVISGGMAYLFIRLLMSILHNLPPIAIDGSPLARSISIGVRYMLVGSIGLMAFMFSVVTIGLLVYSIQLAWQGAFNRKSTGPEEQQSPSVASPPNLGEIVATEIAADSTDPDNQSANQDLASIKEGTSTPSATS